MKTYNNPPTIKGDFVVLPDLHCPCQSDEFIDKVLKLALKWNIKTAVIPGDLLDLEAYGPFVADESILIEEGLEEAEKSINKILTICDSVLYLMGNHENRLLKRIGKNQISNERLKRLITTSPDVEFSEYYYALSEDNKWLVCHPNEFSFVNPVAIATGMATKYSKNVIGGHLHIIAQGQDVTGTYMGVIAGTCADPKKISYDALRPSKKPEMVNGAVIVRNGFHWLLTKWTDWEGLYEGIS